MKNLRRRGFTVITAFVALALTTAGCGDDDDGGTPATEPGGEERPAIVVGQKDFEGAQLLSQLYGQALAAEGYDVTYKNLGPTEQTYDALKNGDINLYGEYQGTLLAVLGGTPTGDATETNAALADALEADSIITSGASTAVDVNGFYVTSATAEERGLENVSDLVPIAGDLVFGGPAECLERDLCLGPKSQELYGLEFAEVKALDTGGPITVTALKDGDIDVGLLFTGSSPIDPDFVLLTDDQALQPADNAIAVWRSDVDSDDLTSVIDGVNALLDTAAYNELVLKIFNDKEDPADVAATWLADNGLA
jgi:osmoprotectant transport system substrate-binding protein